MLPRAQTCLEPERYSGGKGDTFLQGFRAGTRRLPSELSRMARDCWVEVLRCPNCRRIGVARLSATDKFSWDFQVDAVPEGFKAIPLGNSSYFFCVRCDMHGGTLTKQKPGRSPSHAQHGIDSLSVVAEAKPLPGPSEDFGGLCCVWGDGFR